MVQFCLACVTWKRWAQEKTGAREGDTRLHAGYDACFLRLAISAKLLFLRYLLGCFIVPIKFLVTFAIVANSFRIVQAVSIKHVFYNIEKKIYYHVFVTACNPC